MIGLFCCMFFIQFCIQISLVLKGQLPLLTTQHHPMEERILLFTENKVYWLKPNDICALVGSRSYTDVQLYDGSSIKVSKNLKMIMSLYFNHSTQFFRVQKSYVVNLNHIDYLYIKDRNKSMLRLSNGLDIPISNIGIRKQLFMAYGQPEEIALPAPAKMNALSLSKTITKRCYSPHAEKPNTLSQHKKMYLMLPIP